MNILSKLNPTYLTQSTLEVIKRFPFVVAFAFLTGIYFEINFKTTEAYLPELMISAIGISAFLSLSLYLERSDSKKYYWPLHLLLIGLLGLTYWLNPQGIGSTFFRLAQIFVAVHLLVAIAPYLRNHERNSFWFYNQQMFIRFFYTSIYTGVLLAGLVIILATLHFLFHIEVEAVVYRYVSIICIFFFHPLHYLGGVPKNFEELGLRDDYPKGVRVFTKYLLVPLVYIYGIILLTYCVTLVVAGEWPKGIISSMIVGYTLVGIFTELMIYPILNAENEWAKRFSRLFNLTLVILSFVIIAAVSRRLKDYGLTESRYFLVLTGLWLFGMGLYLSIGKKKDIRIIPMSLFIIIFFTAFGPWGAYSVSLRLQMARLEKVLEKNKILVNGKITKEHGKVEWSDADDVTEVLKYILARHGKQPLLPLYKEKTFDYAGKLSVPDLMSKMGVEPTGKSLNDSISFHVRNTLDVKIEGYRSGRLIRAYEFHDVNLSEWKVSNEDDKLIIKFKNKVVFEDTHRGVISRLGITQENKETHQLAPIVFESGNMKVQLKFFNITGQFAKTNTTARINSFDGILLY
jgi:hypothetical protein